MPDLPKAPPHATLRRRCVLTCLSALLLGAGQATAMSPGEGEGLPSVQVAQATQAGEKARTEQQPQGDAQAASTGLADLNAVLAATQKKLEELFKASAALAERREAFEALEQENERLAAALREANTARADLESASKLAQSRIAELTKATEVAVRDSGRIDKELADLRRQNADLAERLAVADSARGAVEAELTQTRSEMQQKLEASDRRGRAVEQRAGPASRTARARRSGARSGAERSRAGRRAGERAGALPRRCRGCASRAGGGEGAAEPGGKHGARGRAQPPDDECRGGTASWRVGAARSKSWPRQNPRPSGDARPRAPRRNGCGASWRARSKSWPRQNPRPSGDARPRAPRRNGCGASWGARRKSWPRQNPRSSVSAPLTPTLTEQVNSLRADSQSAMEAARRNLVVMEERIEQLNTALAGAGLGAIAAGQRAAGEPGRETGRGSHRRSDAVRDRARQPREVGAAPGADDGSCRRPAGHGKLAE